MSYAEEFGTNSLGPDFTIKDSGARQEFEGGMVRDTTEGKIDYTNLRFGPMMRRLAAHLTKGRIKYPDPSPGVPNWTLARGLPEWLRARESAARHFEAWFEGQRDEDHAAALEFNVNLKEYVEERLSPEDLEKAYAIEALLRDTVSPGPEPPPADSASRRGPEPPEAALPLA